MLVVYSGILNGVMMKYQKSRKKKRKKKMVGSLKP